MIVFCSLLLFSLYTLHIISLAPYASQYQSTPTHFINSDNLSIFKTKFGFCFQFLLQTMDIVRVDGVDQVSNQKRNRKGPPKNGESNVNSGGESEHEVHILTERERRKKMRNMFTSLHALIPRLPPKADKSTIVDEAVKYIKNLEETLQTLEHQRQEKHRGTTIADSEPSSVITSQTEAIESRDAFLASKTFLVAENMPQMFPVSPSPTCFQTWFSPNIVMNMCGNDAQISVCSMKKPGLLPTILYILEKHKLEVVSAHISSDQFRSIYMFHVHHAGEAPGQYPNALSVEDAFKLAAGEMNLWLLSC